MLIFYLHSRGKFVNILQFPHLTVLYCAVLYCTVSPPYENCKHDDGLVNPLGVLPLYQELYLVVVMCYLVDTAKQRTRDKENKILLYKMLKHEKEERRQGERHNKCNVTSRNKNFAAYKYTDK